MRRKPFVANCDRCQCVSSRCLMVVVKEYSLVESFRSMRNFYPACRKANKGRWVWPTPMSNDKEIEKALRAQDALKERKN